MKIESVKVNYEDNKALIKCPQCGTERTMSVDKFKGSRRRVKVRCPCQAAFVLLFEFRKGTRKESTVQGYYAKPPSVPVVNTAGAGDALDGGIMLARSQGSDWPAALTLGTAAAASVVMHEGTAVCQRGQVELLKNQVRVQRIACEEGRDDDTA